MEVQITNISIFIYVIISMMAAGALLYFIARFFAKKAGARQLQANPVKDEYHS